MAKTLSWHSVQTDVHHNNTRCKIGIYIPSEDLQPGSGGKPLCAECQELNERRGGPAAEPEDAPRPPE